MTATIDYNKLGKEINARNANIARSTDKWNQYIHDTAVMILQHTVGEGSGDCSRAYNLYLSMGSARRREFLILWFQKYSPIAIKLPSEDKAGKAHFRKETNKDYNPFNIDAARENPWYSLAELEKADKKTSQEILNLAASEKAVLAFLGKIKAKQVKQLQDTPDDHELKLGLDYTNYLFSAVSKAGFDFAEGLEKPSNDALTPVNNQTTDPVLIVVNG